MCFLRSWRLRQLPVLRLMFCFWIISKNLYLITCDDAFHEVLIHLCLLKGISDERQGVFLLFDGEDAKSNFAEMHYMFKSFIKMSWQVAYYMPTPAGILCPVNHLFSRIISCTCITKSLCLLVAVAPIRDRYRLGFGLL
jgi:hypothetical protein